MGIKTVGLLLALPAFASAVTTSTSFRYEGRFQGPSITTGTMTNQTVSVVIKRPDSCGGSLASWNSTSVSFENGAFSISPTFDPSTFAQVMNPWNTFSSNNCTVPEMARNMVITWNGESFTVPLEDAARSNLANYSVYATTAAALNSIGVSTVTPASGQILKYNGSQWAADNEGNLTGSLSVGGQISLSGSSAPSVSTSGQGKFYFDSTSNTFKISQNGGSYADILTSSNAVLLTDYQADVAGANCSTTQTPYWNSGTGVWACQSLDSTTLGSAYLRDGGNSISGSMKIGNNTTGQSLSLINGGTSYLTITSGGAIGLGTTSPSAHFQSNYSSTSNSSPIANYFISNYSPSASTGNFYGIRNEITLADSVSTSTNIYAIQNTNTINSASGTITSSWGSQNKVEKTGAAVVTDGYGTHNIYNNNIGTTTSAYGSYSIVNNNGGTITTATANQSIVTNSSGTITTARGVNVSVAGAQTSYGVLVSQSVGGTNAAGIKISSVSGGATGYGLYIDTVSGTSKWSLYQNDNTAPNYMAAGLTIGNTASPSVLLQVGSSTGVSSGTAVAKFQNADGTCTLTPATSGSGIACSSDERLKENFEDVSSAWALDKLLQLQAVTYNFKSDPFKKSHTGFVAQQVQKIAPEFVRENDDGLLQVYYDGLIPWITEALKTLNSKTDKLEQENSELKKENAELKAHLDRLEERLNSK